MEWCPALDKKPVYPQPLREMEVVTPVVSREHFGIGTIVDRSYMLPVASGNLWKGISLMADDDGEESEMFGRMGNGEMNLPGVNIKDGLET